MNESDMMYIALGFILAVSGFGIYAMEVFRAYQDEKKRIEEDFNLSKKYEPKAAFGKLMVFIAVGSTGLMYVLMMSTLILVLPDSEATLPNSYTLVSEFIALMGATVLVVDLSRIPVASKAMRDIAYVPVFPDYIKNERNMQKRMEMIGEFREKNPDLHPGPTYFGKYFVLQAFPETMSIYILLIAEMLMVFTEMLDATSDMQDISPDVAATIFQTGVLYVVLTIPAIFSMKRSAEIPMTEENFVKKVLVALYGLIPSVIGVVIMVFALVPLIGS